jgi:hypothetical protein
MGISRISPSALYRLLKTNLFTTEVLYNVLIKFEMSKKLLRLINMCMHEVYN